MNNSLTGAPERRSESRNGSAGREGRWHDLLHRPAKTVPSFLSVVGHVFTLSSGALLILQTPALLTF